MIFVDICIGFSPPSSHLSPFTGARRGIGGRGKGWRQGGMGKRQRGVESTMWGGLERRKVRVERILVLVPLGQRRGGRRAPAEVKGPMC